MKFVSLFAGIGGIDLGLERAGHTCVGQVEIDEYATKVLEKHWPNVPRIRDVRSFKGHEFGEFDMLVGGYPCQPFSIAGSRKGERDERHLWPEVHRILRNVRPKYLFVENVTGHLSLGFGRVLGDLAESGYDAEWDCIPAAAVGANHRRDRVFLVARRRTEELADTDGGGCGTTRVCRRLDEVRERRADIGVAVAQCGTDVADANQSRSNLGEAHRVSEFIRNENRDNQESEQGRHEQQLGFASSCAHAANADDDGFVATEERRGVIQGSNASPSKQSITSEFAGCGGESRQMDANAAKNMADTNKQRREEQHTATLASGARHDTWRNDSGRSNWALEPDVGRVADGIPARVDRLRALGNAVVPQVAEWIGWRLPL